MVREVAGNGIPFLAFRPTLRLVPIVTIPIQKLSGGSGVPLPRPFLTPSPV